MLVRIGFAPGYIDPPKISPLFGNLDKVSILEFGEPGAAFTSDLAADLVDVIIESRRSVHSTGSSLTPRFAPSKWTIS